MQAFIIGQLMSLKFWHYGMWAMFKELIFIYCILTLIANVVWPLNHKFVLRDWTSQIPGFVLSVYVCCVLPGPSKFVDFAYVLYFVLDSAYIKICGVLYKQDDDTPIGRDPIVYIINACMQGLLDLHAFLQLRN